MGQQGAMLKHNCLIKSVGDPTVIDPDPDPDPAFFASDLQDTNKK
jgi:hypothetical protein